ncbi:hypothetical protein PG994_015020 [Apiospora phragmitis]|uniref:Uncharacterized protein n=1 Tax=Apiospora phragmitis TaxID=2905665 RepID=A0ABR1SXI1_9PEZI
MIFCLPFEKNQYLQQGRTVHVNKWPCEAPEEGASRLKATSEVPSVIRYGLTDGSVKIGWEALATIKTPLWKKNPSVLIDRFKLLLDTSESTADTQGEVDLIADFLQRVFTHALYFMRITYLLDERDDIELVLTLPTAWSPMAVRKMCAAVDKASKLSKLPIGKTLRTVSETEAAMAYVRKTSRDVEFETGNCVLIGDIGGGTTDTVPYRLESSRLVELAPSTVTFKFREAQTKDLDKFEEDDDGDLGYYCIRKDEIESIFNEACWQVWTLLKKQLDQVIQLGHKVKMIVLVGGFSESLYLRHFIHYECGRSYGVEVMFPHKCQWAVVEGAMIWANNKQYQADRISRYSVGIKRHMPYEPIKRHHKGVKPDIDDWGCNYVKNCLEWVIKRGCLIPADGLTKTYDLYIPVEEDTPRITLSQEIYISETACEDNYRDSNPVNADAELLETVEFSIDMEPIRHLMTLTKLPKSNAKRRKTRDGKRTSDCYYKMNFKLEITINDLGLSYKIECLDSSKKAKTGTMSAPYIFKPGTVLRNSTGDVLGADGG